MKEFLVRLTNVIHWIGFLSPFVFMITMNIWYGVTSNAPFRWVADPLVAVTVGISFSLAAFVGGWLFKYLLTGRKGFFPWMTE